MRHGLLTLLGSLALVTAGCGEHAPEAAAPPSRGSPATAPSSSPTPAAPTSATSSVAATTGRLIQGTLASVRAPAEFRGRFDPSRYGGLMTGRPGYYLTFVDDETVVADEDVDSLARISQKTSLYEEPLERQPDTTIAGLSAYHLAGPDPTFDSWAEQWGARAQGHTIQITLNTPTDLPQPERDALAASILASVTLGG